MPGLRCGTRCYQVEPYAMEGGCNYIYAYNVAGIVPPPPLREGGGWCFAVRNMIESVFILGFCFFRSFTEVFSLAFHRVGWVGESMVLVDPVR